MKYIRTKDNIYEFNLLKKYYNVWLPKNGEPIEESDIIKQADTIEELCDGYIVEHPINAFKFFYEKKEVLSFLNNTCAYMFKFCELCIYSVIKTNKGLIYVAKMNEKGELELI